LNFLRNRLNQTFYEFIKIEVKKVPVIDLSQCTDCDSCLEICPAVFRRNKETGLMEVADLALYPEDEVREAICICPNDCIAWEEE
jgi:ferredoxin